MAHLNLIVIEDENDIGNLYRLLFEREGIEIEKVLSDGVEAINFLDSNLDKLDDKILLVDNRIPEKPGIEVIKWLLNNKPHLKDQIIVATADDNLTESEVHELGIPYFLRKPFSLDDLIETYHEICEKKEKLDASK